MEKVKGHRPLIYGPGQRLSSWPGLWLQGLAWGRGRGGTGQVERDGWRGNLGQRESPRRSRVRGRRVEKRQEGARSEAPLPTPLQGRGGRHACSKAGLVRGVWVSEQRASTSQENKVQQVHSVVQAGDDLCLQRVRHLTNSLHGQHRVSLWG